MARGFTLWAVIGLLCQQHLAFTAQIPLLPLDSDSAVSAQRLKGRFLHITDIHPDPFYKLHSDTDDGACHHGKGAAGPYGAQKSDCDSPYSLVNATFDWINDNLKDEIDFVVWTGDSARHDNDESLPRNEKQVVDQNAFLIDKMRDVFGKDGGNHAHAFKLPIIPTFGNNDILPHNIFSKGPNKWTTRFARLWRDFIPEEQKHQFERSGWFYVEAIPNKLAVFSLNTMYFFGNNAAVDGCKAHSEPGYEHFEWLRIQLQFLRERGMKAIISGHVPPARNDQKTQWDETCWQKYALWMQQYRDVVVGSLWGHMNIEHFFLQDFDDIKHKTLKGRTSMDTDDGDISVAVKPPAYLSSLRDQWAKLPKEPKHALSDSSNTRQSKLEKYRDEIGGEWAERYALSLVSASVVPNFFPTLRVFEYNTTGLEDDAAAASSVPELAEEQPIDPHVDADSDRDTEDDDVSAPATQYKKKKSKKNKKKKKKPRFTVPDAPSDTAPPGPAYSPQPLSWLGYKQYFANLTYINNEGEPDDADAVSSETTTMTKKKPNPFAFELEYDTRNHSDVYELADEGLTVRSLLRLAARIGRYDPDKGDKMAAADDDATAEKKKKHKHKRRRIINRTWYAFVDRAVVRTLSREQLHEQFGQVVDDDDDAA